MNPKKYVPLGYKVKGEHITFIVLGLASLILSLSYFYTLSDAHQMLLHELVHNFYRVGNEPTFTELLGSKQNGFTMLVLVSLAFIGPRYRHYTSGINSLNTMKRLQNQRLWILNCIVQPIIMALIVIVIALVLHAIYHYFYVREIIDLLASYGY